MLIYNMLRVPTNLSCFGKMLFMWYVMMNNSDVPSVTFVPSVTVPSVTMYKYALDAI